MPLVIDVLRRYNQQFVSPEVYLSASGEMLVYILIVAWIITLIWDWEFLADNPLLERLGYNNVCVAFDVEPAKWVCACMYPIMSYFLLMYAITDMERSYFCVLYGDISISQWRFSAVTDILLGMSACWFALTFVVPPDEQVYVHSSGFISLIITRYLALVANWTESRHVNTANWIYLILNGFTSVAYIMTLLINYDHFDDFGQPLWPGYVNGFIDYFWFFQVYFTGRYLPDADILRYGRGTWSRMKDRAARTALVRGKLQAPDEPPLIKHRDVKYGEVMPVPFFKAVIRRILGMVVGPYATDGIGFGVHNTAYFWSKSKDGGESCPYYGTGTMYLSHKAATEQLKKRQSLITAGTHERGNDLGMAKMPAPMFPRMGSIVTGWGEDKQDILWEWFASNAQKPAEGYRSRLEHVLGKSRLHLLVDVKDNELARWAVGEQVRALMPGKTWSDAQVRDFLAHQTTGLAYAVVLGPLPSLFTSVAKSYMAKKEEYLKEIKEWVVQSGVNEEKKQEVIAHVIYDSLHFAGGVSVPAVVGGIVACRLNGFIPYGYKITPEVAPRFVYEVIRNFPPVNATSVWDKKTNKQEFASLCTAGTDPKVWGHKFLVRPMEFYNQFGVNFNEPGGPRFVCPGKALAMSLLTAVAETFDPLAWKADGAFQPEPEAHMIFPSTSSAYWWLSTTLIKLQKPRPARDQGTWLTESEEKGDVADADLAFVEEFKKREAISPFNAVQIPFVHHHDKAPKRENVSPSLASRDSLAQQQQGDLVPSPSLSGRPGPSHQDSLVDLNDL